MPGLGNTEALAGSIESIGRRLLPNIQPQYLTLRDGGAQAIPFWINRFRNNPVLTARELDPFLLSLSLPPSLSLFNYITGRDRLYSDPNQQLSVEQSLHRIFGNTRDAMNGLFWGTVNPIARDHKGNVIANGSSYTPVTYMFTPQDGLRGRMSLFNDGSLIGSPFDIDLRTLPTYLPFYRIGFSRNNQSPNNYIIQRGVGDLSALLLQLQQLSQVNLQQPIISHGLYDDPQAFAKDLEGFQYNGYTVYNPKTGQVELLPKKHGDYRKMLRTFFNGSSDDLFRDVTSYMTDSQLADLAVAALSPNGDIRLPLKTAQEKRLIAALGDRFGVKPIDEYNVFQTPLLITGINRNNTLLKTRSGVWGFGGTSDLTVDGIYGYTTDVLRPTIARIGRLAKAGAPGTSLTEHSTSTHSYPMLTSLAYRYPEAVSFARTGDGKIVMVPFNEITYGDRFNDLHIQDGDGSKALTRQVNNYVSGLLSDESMQGFADDDILRLWFGKHYRGGRPLNKNGTEIPYSELYPELSLLKSQLKQIYDLAQKEGIDPVAAIELESILRGPRKSSTPYPYLELVEANGPVEGYKPYIDEVVKHGDMSYRIPEVKLQILDQRTKFLIDPLTQQPRYGTTDDDLFHFPDLIYEYDGEYVRPLFASQWKNGGKLKYYCNKNSYSNGSRCKK